MEDGELGLVSESNVEYASGDMELTDNQFTSGNIVTAKGCKRLAITVWLSSEKTMYIVDAEGNLGAVGVTFGADAPASFEMPWAGSSSFAFSVRFSAAVTVRKLVINGK
jgi:hypothetical protein